MEKVITFSKNLPGFDAKLKILLPYGFIILKILDDHYKFNLCPIDSNDLLQIETVNESAESKFIMIIRLHVPKNFSK